MNGVWGLVEIRPAIAQLDERSPLAGIARRRFGGKSLLEWVVRHVSDALQLTSIAVVAGNDPLSRSLCELCPPDVPVSYGRSPDALGQLAAAVETFRCDSLVRVNVCNPFIDPVLIDSLVAAGQGDAACEFAAFQTADGRPAAHTSLGVCPEWLRGSAVLRANKLAVLAADREISTLFIAQHPELFATKTLPVPPRLDRADLQLAIHDEDDWHHVQELLDILGPESLDWQVIAGLSQWPGARTRRSRTRSVRHGEEVSS
jgi:spore coat polysaccharide biosynthesis protein SpsF (cytidylyltransferase family)